MVPSVHLWYPAYHAKLIGKVGLSQILDFISVRRAWHSCRKWGVRPPPNILVEGPEYVLALPIIQTCLGKWSLEYNNLIRIFWKSWSSQGLCPLGTLYIINYHDYGTFDVVVARRRPHGTCFLPPQSCQFSYTYAWPQQYSDEWLIFKYMYLFCRVCLCHYYGVGAMNTYVNCLMEA